MAFFLSNDNISNHYHARGDGMVTLLTNGAKFLKADWLRRDYFFVQCKIPVHYRYILSAISVDSNNLLN